MGAAKSKSSKMIGISRTRSRRIARVTPKLSPNFAHNAIFKEARTAGLLDGEKSEHVSFRAPPALIAAAKREGWC